MQRSLVWVETENVHGFGCSECCWVYKPEHAVVGKSLEEMTRKFEADRDKEFAAHVCSKHLRAK